MRGIPGTDFARASPAETPERMDDPSCDPVEIGRALDALAVINRWFGGATAVRRPIEAGLSDVAPGELTLLDVGTGAGDIPVAIDRRLRADGWRPRFLFTDNHATTLRLARDRVPDALESSYVRLDAARLPFADDTVDIGFSGTMLHHLETGAAGEFLREIDRVSRVGWVVSDLRRGPSLRIAFGVLSATLMRNNETARLDGSASIRRAFTAAEVRTLLDRAGLERAVVRSGPIRWVAIGGGLVRG